MSKVPSIKAPSMGGSKSPAAGSKIGSAGVAGSSSRVRSIQAQGQKIAKAGDPPIAAAADPQSGTVKMPVDHPLSKSTATRKGGTQGF